MYEFGLDAGCSYGRPEPRNLLASKLNGCLALLLWNVGRIAYLDWVVGSGSLELVNLNRAENVGNVSLQAMHSTPHRFG